MKIFLMEPFVTFSLMSAFVIWMHSSIPVDSLLQNRLVHLSPAPSPVTSRRGEDQTPSQSNPRIGQHHPARPPYSHHNLRSRQSDRRDHRPPDHKKINLGKKIGLLFIGIAGALQVAVVVFLVFKRWQILGFKDRHDA